MILFRLPIQLYARSSKLFLTRQRFYSSDFVQILAPLRERKLLKISGKDAPNFLQGLITNDIEHLATEKKSMYAIFLNNKGRVLYDTLIYKWGDNETFLIECDKNVFVQLKKHLNIFKLKQVINITDMNELTLWAFMSPIITDETETDVTSDINIFKDPRVIDLGCRILSASEMSGQNILEALSLEKDTLVQDDFVYKYLRYKLGVGEGPTDLPPGACNPLEANCDYLHGVSFHKGCYLGQELTARVHHTGIVRKRLMPIKFKKELETTELHSDSVIKSSDGKTLGKLRGFARDYGLGLVRIKDTLDANSLQVGDIQAEIVKPHWWPIEAPKEIMGNQTLL